MRRHSRLGVLTSAALSLLLALLMWFVSSESLEPLEDRTGYPPDAPLVVGYVAVPDGYAVYDPSVRAVRADLRGLPAGLARLRPSQLAAYVDLSRVEPAAVPVTLPVQVSCGGCARQGVRVVNQTALTTTVRLAPRITETRSVVVSLDDALPSRFRVVSMAADPSQVAITGAAAQIGRVARVVARPPQMGDTRDQVSLPGIPAIPVDVDDRAVPDVAVVPAAVTVELGLRSRGTEVSVSPNVVGSLADGYYVSSISVDPQLVQLDGSAEELAAVVAEGAVVAPLDIGGATEDMVRRVSLQLPEGVTALNAPDGVTVTVRVAALQDTVRVEVPVLTRGLAAGLVIRSISPRRVSVLVGGPQARLADVGPDDVEVFVDLSDIGAGRHTLAPRPAVPSGFLWRSVTPALVDVVVDEVGAATVP